MMSLVVKAAKYDLGNQQGTLLERLLRGKTTLVNRPVEQLRRLRLWLENEVPSFEHDDPPLQDALESVATMLDKYLERRAQCSLRTVLYDLTECLKTPDANPIGEDARQKLLRFAPEIQALLKQAERALKEDE